MNPKPKKQRLTVSLPPSLVSWCREEATARGMPVSHLVAHALFIAYEDPRQRWLERLKWSD